MFMEENKRGLFFQKGVEHSLAGILEQFNDGFEILVAAVIGVGHGTVVGVMPQVLGYVNNLFPCLPVGCQQGHVMQVFSIHADEQVEAGEVFAAYLAGVMVEMVAMALTVFPHPAVGQLASMPVAYPRRIDAEKV